MNTARFSLIALVCVLCCGSAKAQIPAAFAGTTVSIATPASTDNVILMQGTYDWVFPSSMPSHSYSCYQAINNVTLFYMSPPTIFGQTVVSRVSIPISGSGTTAYGGGVANSSPSDWHLLCDAGVPGGSTFIHLVTINLPTLNGQFVPWHDCIVQISGSWNISFTNPNTYYQSSVSTTFDIPCPF